MPFRFKKWESVSKAIRRVGCEQLEDALAHLEECSQAEAIHCARKNIKKARALLRMVRTKIRKDDCGEVTDLLRNSARRLAGPRDAHVQVCTLRKLKLRAKNRAEALALHALRCGLDDFRSRELQLFKRENASSAVQRCLRKAAKKLDQLKIGGKGWTALSPGVKRTYRDARDSCQVVRSSCNPANLHEWRKRSKDLWYQIALLRPLWPEQMEAIACELKTLGEYLGDDHDLSVLGDTIKNFDNDKDLGIVKCLVCERQKELRSRALALGARFFAERPGVFCKRLKSYWRIWRGEKYSRRLGIKSPG